MLLVLVLFWLLAGRLTVLDILERLIDKGAEVPAVEEFVWGFAGGVVAAGQHAGCVGDA